MRSTSPFPGLYPNTHTAQLDVSPAGHPLPPGPPRARDLCWLPGCPGGLSSHPQPASRGLQVRVQQGVRWRPQPGPGGESPASHPPASLPPSTSLQLFKASGGVGNFFRCAVSSFSAQGPTGRLFSQSGDSSRVRKAFLLFDARSRLCGLRTWPDGTFPRCDSWKALGVPGAALSSHHQTQGAPGAGVRGYQAGRVPILMNSSQPPPLPRSRP